MTRVFRTRITGRACENFGAVNYTITDRISEVSGGGVVVTTITRGTCEGARVDEQHEKHWPGVTMAQAADYRLRNGWVEVPS